MWYFVKHGEVIHAQIFFCQHHILKIPLQSFELISGDKINILPYQIQLYYILPFQDLAQSEYIRTYDSMFLHSHSFWKQGYQLIWNFRSNETLGYWSCEDSYCGLLGWHGHLLGRNQYLRNMQPTSGSTYRLCCTLWIPTNLTGIYKM